MSGKPPDLFDNRRRDLTEREAPLAARMRPRTLDEFVGQEHIVGQGRLLRRAIQADQISSLIFFGPPGTGKTTLARIIANTTRAHFIALNAVLAGVADIRAAIAEAQERRGLHGQRTILFVDEVHRFNKAQQDALLPWVENGTVVLIGATTENPYFEVNKALVSRSRIFQLKPLTEAALFAIARQALADPERGYGRLPVSVDPDALAHLVDVANGDARGVLNALELAVETTPPTPDGAIHVTLEVAEESIQRRAVLYDKEGDVHYDTISAFIKSLRGSDPDAALYWMARMIYAGEDPRFIFRRMLILAGEDVGLADPDAIRVVMACAQAFDYVGLPEGRFHLAEAALYLATAPKSNSAMAFFDAIATVEKERETEVPAHLRDASRDSEGFGHGAGYLYPHAYRDHWVAQQYLPDSLQGRVFYQPSGQGYEQGIQQQVQRQREVQLAAMLEGGEGFGVPEILSSAGGQVARDRERWLERALSGTSEHLAVQRARIVAAAHLNRHSVALDLNAGTGLLTWECMRQAPEGGTWALATSDADAALLDELAARLPEPERPIVLRGALRDLPDLLAQHGYPGLLFDAIVGRDALSAALRAFPAGGLGQLAATAGLLRPGGHLSLTETVHRRSQRLHALLDPERSLPALAARLRAAEEAIYDDPDDPLVTWAEDDLQATFVASGLDDLAVETQETSSELQITRALLARWFDPAPYGARPSYAQRLARILSAEEILQTRTAFERALLGRAVPWRTVTIYVVGRKPGGYSTS